MLPVNDILGIGVSGLSFAAAARLEAMATKRGDPVITQPAQVGSFSGHAAPSGARSVLKHLGGLEGLWP